MNDLSAILDELSRTPVLLVASDFDGTLSPISSEPADAKPNHEALVALRALAALPHTHVAIISGRALRDLTTLTGFSEEIHLVGSHGSEFDPDFALSLSPALIQLRDRIRDELIDIGKLDEGFLVEEKPASVAFHYRRAKDKTSKQAIETILRGLAATEGIYLKRGKKVLELSVIPSDKGKALAAIRHRIGASAALFVGDDESDEDAFATLTGPDVGVKVGDEASTAHFRVADSLDVARALAKLAELREAWIKGAEAIPIEKHLLLSDQRTVALLSPNGAVVWFCLPRIDSPALFSELLGGPSAGFFAIRAADGSEPLAQRYVGNTFLVCTKWPTFKVTDYLDCSGGRPYQRASRTDFIRVIEGEGRIIVEFNPRLDFGRQSTTLRVVPEGLQVEGALDPIVLRAPGLAWTLVGDGRHQRAIAEHQLTDQPLILELRHGLSHTHELVTPEVQRRKQTERFWDVWVDQLKIPSVVPDLVRRSALVLKALSYGPTGAIVAAGTMGLPEHIGGVRNWDYRYCWLRDGAMAATALCKLGNTGSGIRFLDWLLGILDHDQASEWFRPLYTVTGGHLGAEAEISELSGYRGSRPVRVGNAASLQLQLDVLGPVMELIAFLAQSGAALSMEHWRLTVEVVKAVKQRWNEPDHGIWEIRRPKRHHVHSKVMCWVAVDRALEIAHAFSANQPEDWISLRQEIANDVLTHGWNPAKRAFTTAYDDSTLDAAALYVGLAGLIPANDSRFISTVEVIERGLRRGPTVYRYRYDDGLPGNEGGFHLCTTWLIEALVLVGRIDDARALFQAFVALFRPTGLAAEEYCPKAKLSLGNHPQAYSHIGLINTAVMFSEAKLEL